MNPRAWAAWCAAALVVVLTSTNPLYRMLVLLVAINVLLSLHRRDASLRGLALAILAASVTATIINSLLSHTGAHVVTTLPAALPGVGGPITLEAMIYGLDVALGLAAAVLAVAPLSRVLEPHELLDAMPRALQRTAAIIGAALNLVPAVARNAVDISEAQRMRGRRGTRLAQWGAVAAPVLLSALDDSLQMAEAMEARGFGSGPRTVYASRRLDARSVAVILAAVLAVTLIIAARASGGLADWYPFPSVRTPDVSLLPVLACLLLATPLVTWSRS